MGKRILTGLLMAGIMLPLLAAGGQEAQAFNAWRDRRGLYGGLSLAGGVSSHQALGYNTRDCTDGALATGLGDGVGLGLRGRVGGAPYQWLTFDLSGGWWQRGVTKGGETQSLTALDLMVGGNLFLLETGLYVRAAAGLTNINVERADSCSSSDTGVVGALGGGFEFFVNNNMTVGAGLELQRHVASPNLNLFLVTVGATWY